MSLQKYIKESEGVFFAGKGLSWEHVIKIWAQQIGLSHESEDIDYELVALHQFSLSVQALQQALVIITEFILEIGERALTAAESNNSHRRSVRSGHGDISVFAVLETLHHPAGIVSIFQWRVPLLLRT